MTREEITALFDERQQAWQRRDPDELAARHAERGVVFSPMFGTLHGRAAIRRSYVSLYGIFPDWDLTTEELLIDGDRVAERFTASATHVGEFLGIAGTRRRFQIQGVRIFDVAGGLVQNERRIYDFTAMLIQIGVLKGKPAKE